MGGNEGDFALNRRHFETRKTILVVGNVAGNVVQVRTVRTQAAPGHARIREEQQDAKETRRPHQAVQEFGR